jgi:hypothetical protein
MSLALLIIIWHDAIVEILVKLTIRGMTDMFIYQRKLSETNSFDDDMTRGSASGGHGFGTFDHHLA